MIINKIIITSVFILVAISTNAQELIQASKYDDLMTAPKIAIAGGGTLMDWANINFYKESNEKLKKISDPNRVVFMGNSITMDWSDYNESFLARIHLSIEVLEVKHHHKCLFDLDLMLSV